MGKSTLYAEGLNIPTVLFPGKDYDFIFRIDHDAFISIQSLNDLCRFIRNNSDIDYISASHNPRKYHSKCQQIIDLYEKTTTTNDKIHKSYAPWGIPGNNGDFWGINKEFCLQWIEKYENDMRIPRQGYIGYTGRSCPQPYLITYLLSFKEVCETLGYSIQDLDKETLEGHLTMDGCFGTDAWTHFCAMKPTCAGIVDKKGSSFKLKGSLKELPSVLAAGFRDYNEIHDEEDISFPFIKNAHIDNIFHIEHGYIAYWHWNSFKDNGEINPLCKMYTHFLPNAPDTFYVRQAALMAVLCKRFGTKEQCSQLETNLNKVYKKLNTSMSLIEEIDQTIQHFYLEPLLPYL